MGPRLPKTIITSGTGDSSGCSGRPRRSAGWAFRTSGRAPRCAGTRNAPAGKIPAPPRHPRSPTPTSRPGGSRAPEPPKRPAQTVEFGAGQPPGRLPRTDPGPEQAFVGIDVSHPGQKFLVQQGGLDGQAPAAEQTGKLRRSDGERLRARPGKSLSARQVAEFQPAEPAGVDKAQFASAGQRQAGVGMARHRGIGRRSPANVPVIPRCTIHCAAGGAAAASAAEAPAALNSHTICLPVRWTATMYAIHQPARLAARRILEGLRMRGEPVVDDPVAAHPGVHAPRYRLHLR